MPRVIERFGGKHGHLGRCLIFIPDQQRQIPPDLFSNTIEIAGPATQWLRDFNCTTIDGHVPDDFFRYYPNGTYEGALGMLQRSEFDTVPYFVRPDSLPFNPVLIGKVVASADVGVGFRKTFANTTERELTSFVTEFPGIVYGYILIALFIFIVSFLIAERKKKRPFFKTLTPKRIAHMIEQTAYCLVDQETLDAETTPGRLVLLTLNILIVIFIYGLFLSKIGADLVVMKEPYNIQSIEDIIESDSQTKPVILKQLFLINLMKEASLYHPESTLARLYPVVMSDPSNNIASCDINNPQNAVTVMNVVLDGLMARQRALVMPTEVLTWMRHFQCLINPQIMSKMQVTKETFAHGMLTYAYAPKIHPMVRKVLDYFFGCFLEMGLFQSLMLRNLIAKDMLKVLPGARITSEVTECQDISNGASISESDDLSSWRPFHAHDFVQVFYIMALFLTVAAIILLLELLWSNYRKKRSEISHEPKNNKIHEKGKKNDLGRWKRLKQVQVVLKKKGKEKKSLRVIQLPQMKRRRHYIDRHPYMKIFQPSVMTAKLR